MAPDVVHEQVVAGPVDVAQPQARGRVERLALEHVGPVAAPRAAARA
jgi:hypothetical protein